MKMFRLLICGVMLLPSLVKAGGGDDHSHGPATGAPVAPTAQVLRVEAISELFELVGVLEGDKLVVHLDRFASNEPVTSARITVEGGPLKATPAVESDGIYTVAAAGLAAPGTHPLVFTVQAGDASDLLTGDLVVAAPSAQAAQGGGFGPSWLSLPVIASVAAALVLIAVVFAWHRRRASATGAPQ
jgi:cobalt-zinc-cadmium efflux system membrane fusion protein